MERKRFDGLEVASAMGFSSYGIFVVEGWPALYTNDYPIDLTSFNETMFASNLRNAFATQTVEPDYFPGCQDYDWCVVSNTLMRVAAVMQQYTHSIIN